MTRDDFAEKVRVLVREAAGLLDIDAPATVLDKTPLKDCGRDGLDSLDFVEIEQSIDENLFDLQGPVDSYFTAEMTVGQIIETAWRKHEEIFGS